jgi:hypothetical protein
VSLIERQGKSKISISINAAAENDQTADQEKYMIGG